MRSVLTVCNIFNCLSNLLECVYYSLGLHWGVVYHFFYKWFITISISSGHMNKYLKSKSYKYFKIYNFRFLMKLNFHAKIKLNFILH